MTQMVPITGLLSLFFGHRELVHALYRDLFSAVKTKKKKHSKNFDILNIFAQNIDCGYTL